MTLSGEPLYLAREGPCLIDLHPYAQSMDQLSAAPEECENVILREPPYFALKCLFPKSWWLRCREKGFTTEDPEEPRGFDTVYEIFLCEPR